MDLRVGADQGFWNQAGSNPGRRWGNSGPATVAPTMGQQGLAVDLPKLGAPAPVPPPSMAALSGAGAPVQAAQSPHTMTAGDVPPMGAPTMTPDMQAPPTPLFGAPPRGRRHAMHGGNGMGGAPALAGLNAISTGFGGGY